MENKSNNKTLMILMIICVCLSIVTLGIVIYDRFIRKEPEHAVLKPIDSVSIIDNNQQKNENNITQCNCPNTSATCFGEKITSIKELNITNTNQNVKINGKNYKVRKEDNDRLYIDDNAVFGFDHREYYAEHLYLTDKVLIFTNFGQYGETIGYALSEKGEVGINNNGYAMEKFKIVDGYLHATGSTEIGFEENDIKDLLIKYMDNTLIVTKTK